MIVIGAVNAAAKPFMAGLSCSSRHWRPICVLIDAIHSAGSTVVVTAENCGPRSWSGSSIDGRVLKNSTPAVKSVSVRPA